MNRSYNVVLALTITVALGLAGCSDTRHGAQAPPPAVSGLTVTAVKVSDLPETLDVVGTVRARTSALVSARISGTVSVLHVREGDRVRKGQLLGQLDSKENLAQATGAVAAIDEAKRGLEEAQARQKLADSTFGRFKRLYDEQALTRQEFDTRQTERELAHQAVARAEARLRQTQEASRAAGAMADYTKIVAPISGIIVAKQADLGSTVFPGQPLMTIDDEGSYQLELAIPESQVRAVHAGTPVQVQIDATGSSFSTRVTEVVPSSDPASRTYTAKVAVPQKGVRSGMFGRGSIALGSSVKGVRVPRSAVFERGALTAVWSVGTDEVIRMRLVKTGRIAGDSIEILSGLSDGDRIVTAGMEKAIDGARLQTAPGGAK
ncbi:efflux RND transporter periplasmic adaptor subunit [Trichlorobacter lovleyi]|uniref:Efflux transporter, RND family, MFP subunit n=1 Tax=Trichlorobacter lovleyi (strain ATCC BAA-1151 / DSM 17278 / SZ) TaxID=398767 RepID=B3E267_TRIL1|nr:efflux RND transporter periplasmic adaptor subunit [Trichlorobacter lovleyi]ACD97170.1 efflux transporter, RND family, MFP subunit [Trichlorobacter lovleyi SZ]